MQRPTSAKALFENIQAKRSFLCIGLDPDPTKLPQGIEPGIKGVGRFLNSIVKATAHLAVAYKPNLAFFESMGPEGLELLAEIIAGIPEDVLVIGDAKRGDIGNTADHYASAIFKVLGCGAVTVSPYMGLDTLSPFLAHEERWTIVLALTSNPGSADFQRLRLTEGPVLWEKVLQSCAGMAGPDRMMFVVGGTHPDDFRRVREIAPDHFLLVPGFGAQQGSLSDVAGNGLNAHCGLLANVSRAVLYASHGEDFAEAAARVASAYRSEMAELLVERGLIASA